MTSLEHILSKTTDALSRGAVSNALRSTVGIGEEVVSGNLGLIPLAKTTLDLAIAQAHQLESPQVTGLHLLLSLAGKRQGFAGGILRHMKVNSNKLQQAVYSALTEGKNG